MTRPPLGDSNSKSGLVSLGPIPSQAPVAAFNMTLHESLLETKGFKCIHYRHALNPTKQEINSPVLNPNTQAASLRGFRYYDPRPLWQVPQQFKLEDKLTAIGIWAQGSVLMTVSGEYDDNLPEKNVQIRNRDLLVMPSLTDIIADVFEYNPHGIQKLKHRVVGVDYLADTKRRYVQDRDFIIEDGGIKWIDGLKPDFIAGQGSVLSCTYFYVPIFVVVDKPHSIRIIPANSTGHAALPRNAIYAPQQVVCRQSNLYDEENPLDFGDLPPYNSYDASANTMGGSK